MFINRRRKELNLKIVYYGPALSGKTTNLQKVHEKTKPELRGELVSLKTREDRTVFFDYMLLELGEVGGLKPRFNLYTVPGQAYYSASRKLVLQGADGIVFVADSQPDRLRANWDAYQDMYKYLEEMGYTPEKMPLVVQFNKRDLPEVLPTSFIQAYLQLDGAIPCFEAVAISGQGVFDTLKSIINRVIAQVQSKI